MSTGNYVFKAFLLGAYFFAATWIIEDLRKGVEYGRIAGHVLSGTLFGLFMYGWFWWRERKAMKRERPPALVEIVHRIHAIIRGDKPSS